MPSSILVNAPALETLCTAVLHAAGCDTAEAMRVAKHLVGASLAGHDSHGVARLPRYVQWKEDGWLVPGRTVSTITDGGALVLLDGEKGFGQTVAQQATEIGIARAKAHGMAIIGLRNAGHVGRIGAYAEQAMAEGLISIHFVNCAGSILVAPFGGVERRFSTAPFCVGVPLAGRPILLDFATSAVAEGKVLVASNGGKPLPEGVLVTPEGALSNDPHTLYGDYPEVGARSARNGLGAIRAFGEHKGSGLALMCELLGGALTGGGCASPKKPDGSFTNGMLSIYLSAAHFGTAEAFDEAGLAYVDWVKSSQPVEAGGEVLLPGEQEARTRAARLAEGIPLPHGTWATILEAARVLGVALPPGLPTA